jgi:hypothetical protein
MSGSYASGGVSRHLVLSPLRHAVRSALAAVHGRNNSLHPVANAFADPAATSSMREDREVRRVCSPRRQTLRGPGR